MADGNGDDVWQEIHELRQKISGLITYAKEVGWHDLVSLRAMQRANIINYSTLQSNMRDGGMSIGNQNRLARAFGFDIKWPQWRIASAAPTRSGSNRTDTATAFLHRFREHKRQGSRLTMDAGMTGKYIDRRFADFRLAVAGPYDPSSAGSEIPLVLSVSFDPRGWPVFLDLTVCLAEVDLQLIPNCDGESTETSGSIETIAFECRDQNEGNFRGEVHGVSQWWRIRTADSSKTLAGTRRRNDGRDCICKQFRCGDEIKAIMTARVSDCFVTVDGIPLDTGEPKERFKEHLMKLAALRQAEATLAEQILTVVEMS